MTTTKRRLQLRYIARADFRKSEATNYATVPPLARRSDDDCVLFISAKGDQLMFVFPSLKFDTAIGEHTVLHSERLRIMSGGKKWNPLMLQNYADAVGITLIGIKSFEEHYRRIAAEKGRK